MTALAWLVFGLTFAAGGFALGWFAAFAYVGRCERGVA